MKSFAFVLQCGDSSAANEVLSRAFPVQLNSTPRFSSVISHKFSMLSIHRGLAWQMPYFSIELKTIRRISK